MREFFYGLILGAATMFGYHHFDIPGVWAYLTGATDQAVQSTGGYGGKESREKQRR